jgi:peptidoglycan-associated lipoprotein
MKERNICFKIGLVILMVGFLVTVSSCSKKKSCLDPMEPYPPETAVSTAVDQAQADAAAQSLSEEDLEAQRLLAQEADRVKNKEVRMKFVNEDTYFNFDDASLTSGTRLILKKKVTWLRENPDATVMIEGHCDERGTEEYNIALGQRRAQSVKMFLINAGISVSRLSTVSYGEERPVDFGNNESAWSKNRRAHFKIQN